MFGIGFTGKLKQTISLQDNSLKNLRDEINALQEKLNSKEIHVTHIAADNAVLKQRVINLDSKCLHYNDELDTFRKFGILIEQDDEGRITRISKEEKVSRVISKEAPPDWATSFQVVTSPKCANEIIPSLQVYYDKAGEVKRKFPLTENDVFNNGIGSENKTDEAIDSIRKNITSKKSCPGKCKEPKKPAPKKRPSTKKKSK